MLLSWWKARRGQLANLREAGVAWALAEDGLLLWRFVPWRATPQGVTFWSGDLRGSPLLGEAVWQWLDAMKRPDRVAMPGGFAPAVVSPCDLSLQFPTVFDWLTEVQWDDGSPRQTSSLLVLFQDGVFKGMLSDKDSELNLWVAGRTLTEVLANIEAGLNNPSADWRVDRKAAGRKTSRVQRKS